MSATTETTVSLYWADREGKAGAWVLVVKRGAMVRRFQLKGVHPDDVDEAEAEAARIGFEVKAR